jgi:photosystem I subunit 8
MSKCEEQMISFKIGEFFMSAQDLPSILVPLVGLVFPAVAMASLFLYIEKEQIN